MNITTITPCEPAIRHRSDIDSKAVDRSKLIAWILGRRAPPPEG